MKTCPLITPQPPFTRNLIDAPTFLESINGVASGAVKLVHHVVTGIEVDTTASCHLRPDPEHSKTGDSQEYFKSDRRVLGNWYSVY